MIREIVDTISIKVTNNTSLLQNVNILGGTSDPSAVPPYFLYQWDLTNESYFGSITATIVVWNTSNPTPISYTVNVLGYNIQAVAFALNTLNLGNFQVSGNIIYVSNDYYIYGTLTISSNAFISTWDTNNTSIGSSNNNQIQLPLNSSGVYNFTVFWGDGTQDTITSWNQAETLHTYATSGIYTIGIIGVIVDWSFGNAVVSDNEKLLSITSWGELQFSVFTDYNFFNCVNLDLSLVTDVPDLSATTIFNGSFDGCSSLTTINKSNEWDTSTINSMIATFADCSLFNSDISSWDVSNVTDLNAMFYNCQLFNQNISNWNTALNTNMYQMFLNASVFNQPIGSWDVSNVTSLQATFDSASNFNQDLSSWNTSNVINMSLAFNLAVSFNEDITNWDVSNVTNFSDMFSSATVFNQNISSWNTISANDISGMFLNATSFNQNINSWNVSNVIQMQGMFFSASAFNISLNSWDVSSVQNMRDMFNLATAFNQNIKDWNTVSVTNMRGMFNGATLFNLIVGGWNVSSVTTMQNMFSNATAFNQDISSWSIVNVSNFTDFMLGKTQFNYSSANLDLIYNNWSLLVVQPNLTIDFGTIKYTLAGKAGRNVLTSAPYNWTINDGGI